MSRLRDAAQRVVDTAKNRSVWDKIEVSAHAVDALEAALSESGWIPVSERVPEKVGLYLVAWSYKGEDDTLEWKYKVKLFYLGCSRYPYFAEPDGSAPKYAYDFRYYWRELPEPPEEE